MKLRIHIIASLPPNHPNKNLERRKVLSQLLQIVMTNPLATSNDPLSTPYRSGTNDKILTARVVQIYPIKVCRETDPPVYSGATPPYLKRLCLDICSELETVDALLPNTLTRNISPNIDGRTIRRDLEKLSQKLQDVLQNEKLDELKARTNGVISSLSRCTVSCILISEISWLRSLKIMQFGG